MRDINLIPKGYLRKKSRPGIIVLCAVSAALILSLMVYLYIVPLNNIRALEQEIKKYDEVVIDYNVLQSKIDKMQENEEIIKKKIEVLDQISSSEVKPSRVFELVNSSLPSDVWLTNVNYTFVNVSVTAVAASAIGATEFYVELNKMGEFKDVELSPITVDENGYNFTIQFSLNTGSDKNEN
ncbi:MAG TPA: PilN domain-containing protein [Clostridia bacterium]|nr:PilN domain-containing protein [Clostridia bacterium]